MRRTILLLILIMFKGSKVFFIRLYFKPLGSLVSHQINLGLQGI